MTQSALSIWCAIPVYNNSTTIFDIARQCLELVPNVIVVDDGSTDADLTHLLKPLDVTILRHPTNRGKGEALLTAFEYAARHGAEYLITLDGDSQHFPADLSRFIPCFAPDTILIGYRNQIIGEMPRSSSFGREFSDFWIRLEAGGNARDTQSGFRAYPLAAVMQLKLHSHFYNFEMEIITKALWAGMRVEGIPVRVWYPPVAERISSFDPIRDNLRISLLHTRLVLRQLLPIPHRKLLLRHTEMARTSAFKTILYENATPIGLAVSAGISILMGIVLWPVGIFAIAYVMFRLHLNKMMALVCTIACLPSFIPGICRRLGRAVVKSDAHPTLQWIVGSHLLAIPLAFFVAAVVYRIAARRQFKPGDDRA